MQVIHAPFLPTFVFRCMPPSPLPLLTSKPLRRLFEPLAPTLTFHKTFNYFQLLPLLCDGLFGKSRNGQECISERSFQQTNIIGISKEFFLILLWSSPAIDTPVRGSDSQARVGTWGFQLNSLLETLYLSHLCNSHCHCHCHCHCLCLMSTKWSICCPTLSWKPDGRHSGNFWGIGAGISGNRHQFPSAGNLPPPTTS